MPGMLLAVAHHHGEQAWHIHKWSTETCLLQGDAGSHQLITQVVDMQRGCGR